MGVWRFFFFSSRRRHTRLVSDWSSDVCSSDLIDHAHLDQIEGFTRGGKPAAGVVNVESKVGNIVQVGVRGVETRSEERRVGKECRCRWEPGEYKKEENKRRGR